MLVKLYIRFFFHSKEFADSIDTVTQVERHAVYTVSSICGVEKVLLFLW